MKEKQVKSNPTEWVQKHGDILYRFALTRLRNPDLAENIVQETLLAGLQSLKNFSGKSSERTWLIGILKHKIIDHYRKNYRETPITDIKREEETIDSFYDRTGHPKAFPSDWNFDPRECASDHEFWAIFEECLQKLPQSTADAFSLREIDKLTTPEICKIFKITATNLWVILHRARLQLRRCLELNWFEQSK